MLYMALLQNISDVYYKQSIKMIRYCILFVINAALYCFMDVRLWKRCGPENSMIHRIVSISALFSRETVVRVTKERKERRYFSCSSVNSFTPQKTAILHSHVKPLYTISVS